MAVFAGNSKLADAKSQLGTSSCLERAYLMLGYLGEVAAQWCDSILAKDDLAQKRHQAAMVSQMATNPRMQHAIQKMQVINQAVVVGRYCPAKKDFVQASSVAEFTKRAAAHCSSYSH